MMEVKQGERNVNAVCIPRRQIHLLCMVWIPGVLWGSSNAFEVPNVSADLGAGG
jgi:hypothetical protein